MFRHPFNFEMFAFIKFAGQITTPGAWQRAQPLRFFSVSSPISYLAHKLSKDPEKRRKQLDEHNAYYKKKYDEDEDYREQRRQSHRESVQAMSDHERRNLRRQNAFFNWVIRGAKNGVVCSPTHTPEHTLVKTTRKCAQCGHYRNKRLWWKRNNTHGSYDVSTTAAAIHRAHHPPLVQSLPT